MTLKRLMGFFIGFAIVSLIVAIYVGLRKPAPRISFEEQLVETNRQSDVASQLRAADKGDLVEFKSGDPRPISFNELPFLCTFVASPPLSQVKRVIKRADPDWSEEAYKYCPYVRPR